MPTTHYLWQKKFLKRKSVSKVIVFTENKKRFPFSWEITMKSILNTIILCCILLTSCATTKPTKEELFTKLSKGFSIQKLPSWEFHGFHGVLNYTPKALMNIGKEYIGNGITVSSSEAKKGTLLAVVNRELNQWMKFATITNITKSKKQTKYGESYTVTYNSTINNIAYTAITNYYKYNNRMYKVSFSAKDIYFSNYVNDALQMMLTFTITE